MNSGGSYNLSFFRVDFFFYEIFVRRNRNVSILREEWKVKYIYQSDSHVHRMSVVFIPEVLKRASTRGRAQSLELLRRVLVGGVSSDYASQGIQ